MKRTIFVTTLVLILFSCEVRNEFTDIETNDDVASFTDDLNFSVFIYQQSEQQVRVNFVIAKIKGTYKVDTLRIRLFDSEVNEKKEFSLDSVEAYDGMTAYKPNLANDFNNLNNGLKVLTSSIGTYFAYDHIFNVKDIDNHKKYFVQLFAILTTGGKTITVAKNVIFKRHKKLKQVRLMC